MIRRSRGARRDQMDVAIVMLRRETEKERAALLLPFTVVPSRASISPWSSITVQSFGPSPAIFTSVCRISPWTGEGAIFTTFRGNLARHMIGPAP